MIDLIIPVVVLGLPHFVQPEIRTPIFVLYFFSIFILSKQIYISRKILLLIAPVFIILALGSLHAPQYKFYDVLLESFRIIGFMFCFLTGYAIYRKGYSIETFFKSIIIVSIILCGKFLFDFISNLSLINILTFTELRKTFSSVGISAPIGIILIIKMMIDNIKLFKYQKFILPFGLVLCSLTLIFMMSRIFLISFVILFIIMFSLHKKIPLIIAWLLTISLVFIIAFAFPTDSKINLNNIPYATIFFEKLSDPLSELKMQSFDSKRLIAQHWRGYESNRTWVQYKNGYVINYLIGSGFGSKVDIGLNMVLATRTYDEILVTHNGYFYLLLKTGIIGFLAYLSFIILALLTSLKLNKSTDNLLLKILSKLIFALMITVLLSTFVASGFINKGNFAIVLVIFGYIAAYNNNPRLNSNPNLI